MFQHMLEKAINFGLCLSALKCWEVGMKMGGGSLEWSSVSHCWEVGIGWSWPQTLKHANLQGQP